MTTPYYQDDAVTLYHGDCLEVLRTLPDCSIDAIVTDPPYGLSFMGKRWDYDVPSVDVWAECLRVLKPGGHLLAFAGTRTQHRMAVRIEDAGFEIRDMIAWVYSSGFPKSMDVSKAIDSLDAKQAQHERRLRFTQWMRAHCPLTAAEANRIIGCDGEASHFFTDGEQPHIATRRHFELLRPYFTGAVPSEIEEMVEQRSVESENMKSREVLGSKTQRLSEASTWAQHATAGMFSAGERIYNITAPATDAAQQWHGWGTALKPALEPITMARKPLIGTVAANVLEHGTGGINVDGCRIGTERIVSTKGLGQNTNLNDDNWKGIGSKPDPTVSVGRWPANLIHDGSDEVLSQFPDQAGAAAPVYNRNSDKFRSTFGKFKGNTDEEGSTFHDDTGSAARFFYCAKASKSDRNEGCENLAVGVIARSSQAQAEASRGNIVECEGGAFNKARLAHNHHPTVKPTDLMRYLCRLVTPPGGVVLDPFTGSGSTGKGAVLEGFRFVGIEREADYMEIAVARIKAVSDKDIQQTLF